MSLRALLEDLRSSKTIIRPPRMPNRLRIDEALEKVAQRFERLSPIDPHDYNALVAKLRSISRSRKWSSLTLRDLRLAASCLFDGQHRLADDSRFLDGYLGTLRSTASRLTVKRLIHTYCMHFDTDHAGIRKIATFLAEIVGNWDWDWSKRHIDYRLFDPKQAPRAIADLTADASDPREILSRVGLRGQLAASGLAVWVFRSAIETIRDRLERRPQIEEVDRAIAWVRGGRHQVYFLAERGALADALLLPWTAADPDPTIRRRIETFLLETLGDPRIDRGNWLPVEPAAQQVMTRWLAQATLEQFLQVVDRIAQRHQWEYRRAFWGAYVEKNAVRDSWVAFASDGARIATQIAATTGDKMMRRFANLSGASPDHAVLILRIGDLVVADWSHNGKLRIWRHNNKHAPRLYLPAYRADELRIGSDFDIPHTQAVTGGWQEKAEAYIRKYTTGVRLSPVEYTPRRRRR